MMGTEALRTGYGNTQSHPGILRPAAPQGHRQPPELSPLTGDQRTFGRRMLLDLAARRSSETLEIQIVYLLACVAALPVVDAWAVAVGFVLVQMSELVGMQTVRAVYRAAEDPRDLLERLAWPAVRNEWIAAFAVASGLCLTALVIDPAMRLGVIAVWCLGLVYSVFRTMFCERSLYGGILIHTVMMIFSGYVYHIAMAGSPSHVVVANVGLCLCAGAMAAFIGRQVRADYLRHLDRERDLAEMVRQLDRENAQKTDFVGHLGHELRTPLNGLMGTVALLKQSMPPGDHTQHLNVMSNSGRTLVRLLNDSLDLSRLEADALFLETGAASVRELVAEQVNLHRANALEKGLDLQIVIDEDVPDLLLLDSMRLMQCLGNLVSNAIKFSRDGTVTIQTSFDADAPSPLLVLNVVDQGIGISPTKLGAIFKPFMQVDSSITRAHEGAGLGLAISRRLARLMGGEIEVRSVEGQGSTFTISVVAMPV